MADSICETSLEGVQSHPDSIVTGNEQAEVSTGATYSLENVVVLKADPLSLPMVCGLCGNQYATARELEAHCNTHKPGIVKRSKGRPKGSTNKSKLTSELPVDNLISEEPGSSVRKSRRSVKRPYADLYVHDEKEMDDLIGDNTASKRKLDQYNKENLKSHSSTGVKIARVEDYVNKSFKVQKSVVVEKKDGMSETDLMEGGLLDTAHSSSSATATSMATETSSNKDSEQQAGNQKADNSQQSDEMSQDGSASTTAAATDPVSSHSIDITEAAGEEGDENITHIEVCLENFINVFDETNAANDPDTAQGKATVMCELCTKIFPSHEMKEHLSSTHMNSYSEEFICPQAGCSRSFHTIKRLRHHLREEHPDSELNSLVLLSKENKRTDKQKKSNTMDDRDDQVTTCEICHKVFKSRRAHSSHMKAHTKVIENVSCQKCGKEFKHSSALKFHNSMMPECDKPKYVCEMCGYKAVTPWRLQSHQMQVHSNDRPFTCPHCQKAYKTKEMLKQHVYKLHTGTPTMECNVCGKKFFYAAELREHQQLHSDTKEFVCPICNRAFKTMHVFRGHMNGKHSDTWYSCGFCKFTTSHKKSMKRHMVLVHKLKNVTLEVTPEESVSMIPQQVEIIQSDELHLDSTAGVHVQYETDVDQVVMQTEEGEVITNEQLAEGMHHLITAPHSTHQSVAGEMNASEVSQVLVALSGGGMTEHVVIESLPTSQ